MRLVLTERHKRMRCDANGYGCAAHLESEVGDAAARRLALRVLGVGASRSCRHRERCLASARVHLNQTGQRMLGRTAQQPRGPIAARRRVATETAADRQRSWWNL